MNSLAQDKPPSYYEHMLIIAIDPKMSIGKIFSCRDAKYCVCTKDAKLYVFIKDEKFCVFTSNGRKSSYFYQWVGI